MYAKYFKRLIDFCFSLFGLILLSPLMVVLTVTGAIVMKGNPFFIQKRPGKKDKNGNEKIFSLIKFRTMTCEKDKDGNLLPDELRLNKYGRFLRATSLDELPELVCIMCGYSRASGLSAYLFPIRLLRGRETAPCVSVRLCR